MTTRLPAVLLVPFLIALAAASSHALSIDEGTFGDLSGDAAAPSAFSSINA